MQGTDTTVEPTAVVVVQVEPGMVTVVAVDGTVGTVTLGVDTLGSPGPPLPDGAGAPEPLELFEPPVPDEGAPGGAPVGACRGAPVDAGPAGAFVPTAVLPDPVVVVADGCATGAEWDGALNAYAVAAVPVKASVAAAKVPARRTRVRLHAGVGAGAGAVTSRRVVRTSEAKCDQVKVAACSLAASTASGPVRRAAVTAVASAEGPSPSMTVA